MVVQVFCISTLIWYASCIFRGWFCGMTYDNTDEFREMNYAYTCFLGSYQHGRKGTGLGLNVQHFPFSWTWKEDRNLCGHCFMYYCVGNSEWPQHWGTWCRFFCVSKEFAFWPCRSADYHALCRAPRPIIPSVLEKMCCCSVLWISASRNWEKWASLPVSQH